MFGSPNTWIVTHKASGLMCLCEVSFVSPERQEGTGRPPEGFSSAMVVATREDGHLMGAWIKSPGYGAVHLLKATRQIAESAEGYWEAQE